MKIVGDTGLWEYPAGRVVDLPYLKAKRLIEQGLAVPVQQASTAAAERR